MKLVLIEWVDSHSGRGWRDLDEIKEECRPLYCRSVGWLLAEKDGCKIIVPHVYDDKNGNILLQGCGDIAIPNEAIRKITVSRK